MKSMQSEEHLDNDQRRPITPTNYGTLETRGEEPRAKYQFFVELGHFALYHVSSVVLGAIGMLICPTLLILGICTTPLCCFGVVLLHILTILIQYLARLDVSLYNFVAPEDQRILINVPLNPTNGFRLSTALGNLCSTDTIIAMLYLGVLKFPLSIALSCFCVSLLLFSAVLVCSPIIALMAPPCSVEFDQECLEGWKIALLILPGIILSVVALRFIRWLTNISMYMTRLCCCEYFSNFVQVYTPVPAYYGQSGIRIV